ncbi:S-layer family protein [Flavobacterium sp. B17]|uniref:beta strand repeat-containing protein n=1 Tax=Flavobacterium sp. B17 TaxID=95618 RepID=UPI000346EDDF|nr:S-layer family protein [Flavobacterium sp. B17]
MMKLYKYVALFLFMCSAQALTAQERPYNSMIFRSQIFDNGHQPVKNEKLNVEVELFTKDKVWYSETQQINTNNEGYVFIQVGKGSLISGKFNEVPFSNQEISLRIKYKVLDSNGNASGDYVQLQSTDLYAVPYAFHALTAESLVDKDTAQLPSDSGQGGTSSDSNSTLASKGNTWSVYGNKYIGMRGGFLGTVDDSPLNLKTNNQTRINITPDGKINFLGDVNLANSNTLTVTNLTTDHLTANNAAVNSLVAQTGVIESAIQSTNPDNGALTVKGGAGIKKNMNVGENLTVYNTTNLLGDMKVNGTARFSEKAEFDKQIKINDATESNTLNEGSVVTAGGASIAKNLNVGGNMKLSGNSAIDQNLLIGQNAKINGTDNATNKDHGALIIESGGLGVEKDIVSGGTIHSNTDIVADNNLSVANTSNLNTLNVAGNTTLLGVTKIQNNTFSSTPLEGALVVDGGVGIGENLNVNKNANITENLTAKNITVSNAFQVNGTADAIDQNSGALIVADGGLGVEKNIYSGKDIVAVKNITANENLTSTKNTNVGQNLNVVNKTTTAALDVANAATIGGITTITNATHSTNAASGALVVNGGVGVNENINIGNDINAGGNLNITKNANITENLTAKNIAVSNGFQVNGDADAVDQNSGALVVAGGLGIGKNIYSGKNITAKENLISTKDTNVGQNLTVGLSTTTSSLNVNNAATIGGITTITNAAHSTNATSGALVVNGGVGVNENINIGNDINAGGNLNITKNANITENLTAKNITVSNAFQVNGTADAIDQNSGALIVADGGLGVEKNVYSGKDIVAVKNITANENLTSTKNTNVGQNLNVVNKTTTAALDVANTATIGGITTIINATHSTNATSGALVVNGGVGIKEDMNVGEDISVTGNTNLNGNLYTNKKSTFNDDALFNKQMNINSSVDDDNDKALEVTGGAIIGKRLHIKSTVSQSYGAFTDAALKVDGGAIINGNLSVLGQVFSQNATINTLTPLSVDTYTYYSNPYQRPLLNGIGYGPDNLYNSYAIRINAVDQGIAIKVNRHAESNHGAAYGSENSANATTGNNFMSFWNKDGNMIGRIEGETLPELTNFGKEYLRTVEKVDLEKRKLAVITTLKTLESALEVIEKFKSDNTKSTAEGLLSITGFTPTGGPLVDGKASAASAAQFQKAEKELEAWAKIGLKVATFGVDGEITTEKIGLYEEQLVQLRNTVGVKYSSSAGDYAEYLELMDYNDSKKLIPAKVVGVKGGKISLNTEDCDKIMVISMNPAVVGKEPSKENEYKFKPVAFMGQVPVFVLNRAKIGDYIVPSGNNDGYAIAKSPDQMSVDEYKKIIGIAWEETNASKTINVAVGINTNDVVDLIKNQDKKIDLLEEKIVRIEKYLAQNSGNTFSEVESGQKADNQEQLMVSKIAQSLKNDNDFRKIASAIAEKLRVKNINALPNKDIYIENEINNYFAGMFFDKKFNNALNEKEQKLLNIYLKGAAENIKSMLP